MFLKYSLLTCTTISCTRKQNKGLAVSLIYATCFHCLIPSNNEYALKDLSFAQSVVAFKFTFAFLFNIWNGLKD